MGRSGVGFDRSVDPLRRNRRAFRPVGLDPVGPTSLGASSPRSHRPHRRIHPVRDPDGDQHRGLQCRIRRTPSLVARSCPDPPAGHHRPRPHGAVDPRQHSGRDRSGAGGGVDLHDHLDLAATRTVRAKGWTSGPTPPWHRRSDPVGGRRCRQSPCRDQRPGRTATRSDGGAGADARGITAG